MCRNPKTKELFGYDFEIINELSRRLNFTLKISFLEGEEQWGTILSNGTVTGGVGKVTAGEADIGIGNYYLRTSRLRIMDASFPYTNDRIVLVIPPGKMYSPFEKLLQPFDMMIWILLLATFLIGVVVILVINYKAVGCKSFVFGKSVKSPVFNMISIIFGNPQMKLPGRNFARYILMLFLLFCLIYRNIYQGALYIFLQSEARHGEIKTIEEMTANKFDFYFYESYSDFVHNTSRIYMKRKIIKHSSENPFISKVDENLHAAFMTPLSNVLNHNRISKFPMIVCKAEVSVMSVVMFFPKNHPIKIIIDEKLQYLDSSNMIDYWIQNYANKKKYLRIDNQATGPRKLTIVHLLGVFNILFVGYTLAAFVFACEFLIPKLKENYRRLSHKR